MEVVKEELQGEEILLHLGEYLLKGKKQEIIEKQMFL